MIVDFEISFSKLPNKFSTPKTNKFTAVESLFTMRIHIENFSRKGRLAALLPPTLTLEDASRYVSTSICGLSLGRGVLILVKP